MKYILFAVSAALIVAMSSIGLVAQSPPKAPRFEVDPNWPQIPNNWVLGEVTSISVDRNDRIWVLHVPRSIPEAQRANAAPPVLQFDAAGKLLPSRDCSSPRIQRERFLYRSTASMSQPALVYDFPYCL